MKIDHNSDKPLHIQAERHQIRHHHHPQEPHHAIFRHNKPDGCDAQYRVQQRVAERRQLLPQALQHAVHHAFQVHERRDKA